MAGDAQIRRHSPSIGGRAVASTFLVAQRRVLCTGCTVQSLAWLGILPRQGAALRPQQGDEMLAAVGLALLNQLKPASLLHEGLIHCRFLGAFFHEPCEDREAKHGREAKPRKRSLPFRGHPHHWRYFQRQPSRGWNHSLKTLINRAKGKHPPTGSTDADGALKKVEESGHRKPGHQEEVPSS